MRTILWTVGMLLFAVTASAQPPVITSTEGSAPAVMVGPGWEAFPNVEYQGGDATQPKKRAGMLVLTDSTLAFYECTWGGCITDKKQSMIRGPAIFMVALKSVTDASSSNQVRGSTMGGKLLLGGLAGDRTEEFFGFVYESKNSAESPVFKTMKSQSGAIEAKIKFRLKKLGVALTEKP